MAVYEVFSHPELRRYKATLCSKATLIMLAILVLTFIPPLFVVYRSYGFWIKEATYREIPTVAFKHDILLIVELNNAGAEGNYLTYSTFQMYNQLQEQRLRIPVISSREVDSNGDGKFDHLIFDLDLPLTDTENVLGVKLLLFFYYKLLKFSSFHMESLGYIEHESARPGARLAVYGDLRFHQKQALAHKGIDNRFNDSIIDSSSTFAEEYDLSMIFKKYSQRNVTTVMPNPYKVWTSGRAAGAPFRISATIDYPEESYLISYTPGFWYLIKWGWVQYVAVLALFLFLFERVKVFIFHNQLVTTIVDRPFNAKNKLT
ncbi:hypothetical protein BaRGS_00010700 [Batillaria attramentaria]|uniref:Transmembrane protein 231 n=1 Tax=Batillaria attramentaria TaxID=370345 RepID=A0ABD0LFK3_9CAEN